VAAPRSCTWRIRTKVRDDVLACVRLLHTPRIE
jgi:hypothetical protein